MSHQRFKHEGWLYALALLGAAFLRFTQLGLMPLTDGEAAPALQALQIASGLKPTLGAHPFYTLSTALLFFINGGGTDFLARFVTALAGSLLVLAPVLFTDRIKPRAALILAFFLAFEPGLIALSRQAASPILAVTFLVFFLGMLNQNRQAGAAAFFALAILSGPSVWLGLLGLGASWGILRLTSLLIANSKQKNWNDTFKLTPPSPKTSMIFAGVLLIAGSMFFWVPNGLSAAFTSISEFFKGWMASSGSPAARLLFSLLIYEPFGVLLASLAIIRGLRSSNRRIIIISVWLFSALTLVLLYPSRQISDLAWVLIPLWVLAAMELTRGINIRLEERSEILGVVLLTVFTWAFAWLDFSALALPSINQQEYTLRVWLLVGALALLVVSWLLVAAGWSVRVARIGAVWGMAIVLGLFGFGGAMGITGLRGLSTPELWWLAGQPVQARLLQSTVGQISDWGRGNDHAADIVIAGINSPALEWALRDHPVSVVQVLDSSSAPDIVITPLQDNPALASSYRGQDFSWRQTPLWDVTIFKDWLRWISLREMPVSGESLILWAREGLFLKSGFGQ